MPFGSDKSLSKINSPVYFYLNLAGPAAGIEFKSTGKISGKFYRKNI